VAKSQETEGVNDKRLKGWKEIAHYFERDASTVRRWEAEAGLPIYRTPGSARGVVYAYQDELEQWLKTYSGKGGVAPSQPAALTDDTATPSEEHDASSGGWKPTATDGTAVPLRKHGTGKKILVTVLAVTVIGLLVTATISLTSPRSATQIESRQHRPPEHVRKLYSDGVYLLEKRSRDSLPDSVQRLESAVKEDPRYDLAWAALATAYNLMVEYRLIDADAGYAQSKSAAEKALALNPNLAHAQAVLADIEFTWSRNFSAGLARFEKAAKLDPANAQTRHWYASALALSGEPSRALVEIERARFLDPTSRSIQVSQGIVLLSANQPGAAAELLEALIRHEPLYSNPYRFLSFARLAMADYPGYLDALGKRFELSGNRAGQDIIAAGRRGLAASERDGMASAMLAAASPHIGGSTLDPYFVAHLHALAGDWQGAIRLFADIETRHTFYYSIDPAFSAARRNADFRKAMAELKLPVL